MGRLGLAIVCGGLLAGAAVQGAQAAAATGPTPGISSVTSSQGSNVYLLGQDVFHDPLSGKHTVGDSGGGYATFVNVGDTAISFQASNAVSGAHVKTVSTTAVNLNIQNGSHAITDGMLHSSITPAGLGFYVASTDGGSCLYTSCSLGGSPFSSLRGTEDSTEIGRVGVKFTVLKNGVDLGQGIEAQMSIRANADGFFVDDAALKEALSSRLDGFTLATNPDSNKAFGYAWDETGFDVDYGEVGAGEAFTLTYLTEVTSISTADCFNASVNCLISYAGFGDPIGRGGGIESIDSFGADFFSLSSFIPDAMQGPALSAGSIDGLNFGVAQFQFPTFNADTGEVGFRALTGGVPEPATWAVMILGFGVVGTTLRRRRVAGANA